jgi:uncharacterized integral membrane protein
MLLSLVFAVVLSVLAVFFANDNQTPVQLHLLGIPLEGTLGIIVVVAFGLGALMGVVMMLPAYLAQGWALVRLRRSAEDLEHALRSSQPGSTKQV